MTSKHSSTNHFRRKSDQKTFLQYRSLQLLNGYRLVISAILFSSNFFNISLVKPITEDHYFLELSFFHLAYSVLALLIGSKPKIQHNIQVHINVLIDVIIIALFTLSAGGVESGWGTLIIAPIAGASLLLPGRTALLFASYGTVTLLVQELIGGYLGIIEKTSYSQTGLLGIALFATAILAITLAKRASESAKLAEKRGIDLANLAQLNEHLISRIDSGIMVIDEDNSIKLINRAAMSLLDKDNDDGNTSLENISPKLFEILEKWHASGPRSSENYTLDRENLSSLNVRITKVGSREEDKGSVIYLNDTSEFDRQVQENKLASLGRLTASIAHEIRNPLGAISHAAQLLEESDTLSTDNKRLGTIIHDQSNRLNKIIESVLNLSRRNNVSQEKILLFDWSQKFILEFGRMNELSTGWCDLNCEDQTTQIWMDTNHLHQVLWNLCSNALKYGCKQDKFPIVTLKTFTKKHNSNVYMDVIDDGPGVSANEVNKLFEPFYTTSNSGTGLGLYISKELCLMNGGDLSYISSSDHGSCFRIRFPLN
ncbi:MAG: ATP-binding protein [Pseudomonadota bacterium]